MTFNNVCSQVSCQLLFFLQCSICLKGIVFHGNPSRNTLLNSEECTPPQPSQTGWYSIYLPQRDGRLNWPWCWLYSEMIYLSADKSHIQVVTSWWHQEWNHRPHNHKSNIQWLHRQATSLFDVYARCAISSFCRSAAWWSTPASTWQRRSPAPSARRSSDVRTKWSATCCSMPSSSMCVTFAQNSSRRPTSWRSMPSHTRARTRSQRCTDAPSASASFSTRLSLRVTCDFTLASRLFTSESDVSRHLKWQDLTQILRLHCQKS